MTPGKTAIFLLVLALAAAALFCMTPAYARDAGPKVLLAASKKPSKKSEKTTVKKKKAEKAAAAKPAPPPKPDELPDAHELAARGEWLVEIYDGTDRSVLDRAEECFMKAVEADPGCAPAHTGLSRVTMYRGYKAGAGFDDRALTRALALVDTALGLDPKLGAAHLQRGYILHYLGSHGLAREQADKAQALGVHASALHGEVAMRTGRLAEAKLRFNEALAEAGNKKGRKADAYDALGEIAMAEADYDTAARMFKSASALRPDSAWEASNYGLALVQQGRFDEAILVLGFILKKHDFPQARINLALAYLKKGVAAHDRGDLDAARGCYIEAIGKDPALKPAYRNLAAIYDAKGDAEGLRSLCDGALRHDPDDTWARQTLEGLGEGSSAY